MTKADRGAVRAAGALCWRAGAGGGLEVLLVRSARWDEWSWPKGKLEAAERAPAAAVREVAEETGATVRLGRPLPSARYRLADGRPKEVRFWAARVLAEGPRTAGADEIAEQAWVPAAEAQRLLPREAGGGPLHRLLDLHALGELDTRALLVVRHAKAVPRKEWRGGEDDRPLTPAGRRQAAALVPLLACWRPDRLVTSPWARCAGTVEPYAHDERTELLRAPELTEDAALADPDAAAGVTRALLEEGADAAVCTHRKALPPVLAALRAVASGRAATGLPHREPWLAKGELLVAHVLPGEAGSRLGHTERHRPAV